MASPARIELGSTEHIKDVQAVEIRAGELFREIGLTSIADDDPPTPAQIQGHIDNGTLWVAVVDDSLVGYLTTSVVDGDGHIDQVSVDPAAGRSGIGSALVEVACEWARSAGLVAVTLTTFAEVSWNGPFYLKRGFAEMNSNEVGPELATIRESETASGIEVAPRIAMRRLV